MTTTTMQEMIRRRRRSRRRSHRSRHDLRPGSYRGRRPACPTTSGDRETPLRCSGTCALSATAWGASPAPSSWCLTATTTPPPLPPPRTLPCNAASRAGATRVKPCSTLPGETLPHVQRTILVAALPVVANRGGHRHRRADYRSPRSQRPANHKSRHHRPPRRRFTSTAGCCGRSGSEPGGGCWRVSTPSRPPCSRCRWR